MRRVVPFSVTFGRSRRTGFPLFGVLSVLLCWLVCGTDLSAAESDANPPEPAPTENKAVENKAVDNEADGSEAGKNSTAAEDDGADETSSSGSDEKTDTAEREDIDEETSGTIDSAAKVAAEASPAPSELADLKATAKSIGRTPTLSKSIAGKSAPNATSAAEPKAGFAETTDAGKDPPLPQDVLSNEVADTADDGAAAVSNRRVGPAIPDSAKPKIDTASFKSVRPGESTTARLKEAWGEPVQMVDVEGGAKYIYTMPPFREAAAVVEDGIVTSLVISLETPLPADKLAAQLDLLDVRGVEVPDEFGAPLGKVFPERGVLFGFAPKSKGNVGHVILEPVDIQPFLWRAEVGYRQRLFSALADLEFVLEREPDTARAHWLRAQVLGMARYQDAAVAAAAEAVRLSPDSAEYRATYARQLEQTGQLDRALVEVQEAIELADGEPELKGRALLQWADLAASGTQPDFARSVELRQQAIKQCLPLTSDRRVFVRDAANEVLFDAYLGLAHDIAWGNWNRKPAVVPRWLSQANKLGRRLARDRNRPSAYQFAVARAALDASVGMEGRLRVDPFVKLAIRSGDELADASDDPWTKARWRWETGLALFDVTQVYQLANKHEQALRYGELAVARLQQGSKGRTDEPSLALVLGQARFRVGSIHAVAHGDHEAAVTWFERAAPLLERPLPEAARADTGAHGERFVSMAVSYWETGARDEAVRLTKLGADVMEQGVKLGVLERRALAVPLNNLALMHRSLGDSDQARQYERTASRLTGTIKR